MTSTFLFALAGLLCAQAPAPERFEVASLKPRPPDSCCFSMNLWGGVTDKQISNTDRLGNDVYDVSATPEHGPILKAMLEESF